MNFQHSPPQYFSPPPNFYTYYHHPNNYPYPIAHDRPVYSQPQWTPPTAGSAHQVQQQQLLSTSPSQEAVTRIHVSWKGKIAPLPGFSSPPDMFAFHPKNQAVKIRKDPSEAPSQTSSPSNATDPNTFIFDKYADVFIPQFLKDIQQQPQTFQVLTPIPSFPSSSYPTSFLPSSIIEKFNQSPSVILESPPLEKAVSCPPLNVDDYQRHWTSLLSWELNQLATDKENITLWQVRVRVLQWDQGDFSILVPGIRENYPYIILKDTLFLREILVDWKVGSGIAFEGRVTRLRKREGLIDFHCPALKTHIETYIRPAPGHESPQGHPVYKVDEEVPPVFNISFMTNAYPSCVMDKVACQLGSILSKNGKRDVAHRWLFPETEDLYHNPPIPSVPPNIAEEVWVDDGLNTEQRLAASSISKYQSPVPFLISGPPGTGKTRTVVETVHQILRTQPEAHILLCAPSNPATDTLAQRLGSSLKPGDMLRLNDQNRTFAEVPDSIRQFCCVENDQFAIPPWKSLMKYRIVVTSCLDANILVEALCTNLALCSLEEHTMFSLHPHKRMKHQIVPHWTHLLIDEAAQGLEPELLVPISVVLTRSELSEIEQQTRDSTDPNSYNYHPLSITPQLVLCGDPHQLGPIITSPEARTHELDVSLLERLFDRPLYADAVHFRGRLPLTGLPLHQDPAYIGFKPFANLVKNYRSHPAILMPPSAMFYNDSLEPCATNGLISWAGLKNNKLPMMFLGCDDKEESFDERATWSNIGEVDRVAEVITSLMSEASKSFPPLRVDEIGVMAPWREQVWKIREKLRQISLSRVDVGTVEDYQGREKRVIIISCVRSSARFLKEDGQKGIGLVFEKKRMNVAITRAKELLVIVGNGNLLKCDPYWKGMLQFVFRNDLYVGPELIVEDDGAWVSRLESKIAAAEEENGLAPVDHTGMRSTMMLAGGVVREVLRDDF